MMHVNHLRTDVNGVDAFYREAGPKQAPVILLPHGYPCSSYEFRNLIPMLADRWRVIAPDFPGCGYSATPDDFSYDFEGYAAFLSAFAKAVGAERFALYLHDFGTWIALRLAMREPQRIAALIIQKWLLRSHRAAPASCPDPMLVPGKTPGTSAPLSITNVPFTTTNCIPVLRSPGCS